MRRFAFVMPRYGERIVGGEVTLMGSLAERLAARGDQVQILTTCARDNRTWENEFPPGECIVRGVRVRRFPVDARDLEIWIPRQIKISEGFYLSLEDQLAWMEHSVNSRELYRFIAERGTQYDALFFAPYLFGTTFWGSLIHPQRSYLIPCLHDEHYAYVDCIASMFRQVAGAIFNALPEQELAQRLYGAVPGGEVGMGFDPPSDELLRPYFAEPFPYVVYLGRKETGKNAHKLVDWFVTAKARSQALADLRLVVVGGGAFSDLQRPHALARGDVIDLSNVTEEDKQRILAHALFLCQPSENESFSIVMMESWLRKRPVVVSANCAVTRAHVVESGGGLFVADEGDFTLVAERLVSDPALAAALGEAGCAYVRRKYAWDAVLQRFDNVIDALLRNHESRPSA